MQPIGLRRGGENKSLAPAVERKGNDLALRVGSPPFGEGLQIRHPGQPFSRHHGTKRDYAGKARVLGAEHRGAHRRVNPVGADQHVNAR